MAESSKYFKGFLRRYMKGVKCSTKGIKGLPFLSKNGIQKGKGLDLGAEPPRYKTLLSSPRPPRGCYLAFFTRSNIVP